MSSVVPPTSSTRPWWNRSKTSDSPAELLSPKHTLKPNRSFSSPTRDDTTTTKPDTHKPSKRNPPSKLNTLASAIGIKVKKPGGPSLAIQDPPSPLPIECLDSIPDPARTIPVPSPIHTAHRADNPPLRAYTNRPPAKSVSSTVRSWDEMNEPRTPSDVQERLSYQPSVMTMSDMDPFAAGGFVLPKSIPDPLRLSVFSDNSQLSSSDSHSKRGGRDYYNRQSYASSSSQSNSIGHNAYDSPPPLPTPSSGNLSRNSSKRHKREVSTLNRLSEPPSDPTRFIHRPPMRARGMTDVGPRPSPSPPNLSASSKTHLDRSPSIASGSSKSNSNGSTTGDSRPRVVVRQASTPRLHTPPAGPPPPVPIPPPPPILDEFPLPRSGPGSDSSTVKKSKDSDKVSFTATSYHTALESSQNSTRPSQDSVNSSLILPSVCSMEDDDSDDASGSSLSFASSLSGAPDIMFEHGQRNSLWSTKERNFKRHGSNKATTSKGKEKEKIFPEVNGDTRGWEAALLSARSPAGKGPPPPSSPPRHKSLKKASSHQSIGDIARMSFASSVSAHSMTVDESLEREREKARAPKKQRSFHHPRLPLPPLPYNLRHAIPFVSPHHHTSSGSSGPSLHSHGESTSSTIVDHNREPTPTHRPSSSSIPHSPLLFTSNVTNDTKSSPTRPHSPVRKRLFSGSSLRHGSTSQANSPTDEDTSVVSNLPDPDYLRGGMPPTPNQSVASFWDEGDGDDGKGNFGTRRSMNGHSEYVPQQIMSPADMLKLEALVMEETQQGDGIGHRLSVSSLSAMVESASDDEFGVRRGFVRASREHANSPKRTKDHAVVPSVASPIASSPAPAVASTPDTAGGASAAPGLKFWGRSKTTRSSHDTPQLPAHPSKHTNPSLKQQIPASTPSVSSPLSPRPLLRPLRTGSTMSKGLVAPVPRLNTRPSTSQGTMGKTSPPTSPTASLSFFPSPPGSIPAPAFQSPNLGLPPPPRRRPRTGSELSATSSSLSAASTRIDTKRSSIVPIHPLSPPPRRPTTSPHPSTRIPYPPPSFPSTEKMMHRRSIMKKPSFLDIEDEMEPMPEKVVVGMAMAFEDDNFLDFGKGKDSFDTVRSVDMLELVGKG